MSCEIFKTSTRVKVWLARSQICLHALAKTPSTKKSCRRHNYFIIIGIMHQEKMSPKRVRIIPLQTSNVLQEPYKCALQMNPQPAQQQSSFLLLKPLVRQLASIGVPSSCKSDVLLKVLNSIVLILQKNEIDDCESTRELHGLLIINIGFFLPYGVKNTGAGTVQAAETHDAGVNTQIVSDLLRCMLYLYSNCTCRRLIQPSERMESYFIILQLANGVFDDDAVDDDDRRIHKQINVTSNQKTVKNECRKILDIFLHQDITLSHLLFENRYEIERLLLALIQTAFDVGPGEERKEPKVAVVDLFNVLQSRPVFGPTACCLAAIASDILLNRTNIDREKCILGSFSTLDQLFYLKCSLISKQITATRTLEILDSLIQQQSKSTNSIRLDVLQCFDLLKNQLQIPSNGKIVAEGLLKCAVNDEVGLDLAFTWMSSLVKGRQKGFHDRIINADRLKELTKFLVPYTFRCNDRQAPIPAAGRALVHIISLRSETFSLLSNEEKESLVSLTSDLLIANLEGSITENAMEIVEFLLTSSSDMQKGTSLVYQQLVFAVAEAACNEFATDQVRRGAVRIIWMLVIKDEGMKIETLTRIPKVLESLVNIASLTEDNSLVERTKALQVLLRLSGNVCNQRILAKHPGLLSSLIRYTRSVPRENRNVEDATIRESTKQQILLLASAL